MAVLESLQQLEPLARAMARAEHYRCHQSVHGFTMAEIEELNEIRDLFARYSLSPARALIARFAEGPLEPIPSDEELLEGFLD
jgi:hypothetical protein